MAKRTGQAQSILRGLDSRLRGTVRGNLDEQFGEGIQRGSNELADIVASARKRVADGAPSAPREAVAPVQPAQTAQLADVTWDSAELNQDRNEPAQLFDPATLDASGYGAIEDKPRDTLDPEVARSIDGIGGQPQLFDTASIETAAPKPEVSAPDVVTSEPDTVTREEAAALDEAIGPVDEVTGRVESDAMKAALRKERETPPPTPPVPENVVASAKPTQSTLSYLKNKITKQLGRLRRGSALNDEISAHPDIRFEEVGVSPWRILDMYRTEPESMIRELVREKDPTVNESLMLTDDKYAVEFLIRLFRRNNIVGLCRKTVNDEATKHTRIIRLTTRDGKPIPNGVVLIHPSVSLQFTADFDGDKLSISFDPLAIAGAHGVARYLKGTGGDLRIDWKYYNIFRLVAEPKIIHEEIALMLDDMNATKEQIGKLVQGMIIAWSKDQETGVRQIVEWAAAISENPENIGRQDYVVGEIMDRIYRMNGEILRLQQIITGVADENGFVPRESRNLAANAHLRPESWDSMQSEPTIPTNAADFKAAFNAPVGSTKRGNSSFRFNGVYKRARISKDIVLANGWNLAKTAYDLIVLQVSGMSEYGERKSDAASFVRRRILETVVLPEFKDNQSFVRWFREAFIPNLNYAAMLANSASANVGLDKRYMKSSDRIYMDVIDDSMTVDAQLEAAISAFIKIFGEVRMRKIFGAYCPKDAGRYTTLNEYIKKSEQMPLYRDPEAAKKEQTDKEKQKQWDSTTVETLISLMVNTRTKTSNKIDRELNKAASLQLVTEDGVTMTKLAKLFKMLMANDLYNQENQEKYDLPTELRDEAEILVDMMNLLHRDVFNFLGLNNPAAFFKTDIGRRFLKAQSTDEVKGLVYEAIAAYRFDAIRRAEKAQFDAMERGDVKAQNRAEQIFQEEIERLASSSDVWRAVANAYRDRRVFGQNTRQNSVDVRGFTGEFDWLSNSYGSERGQTRLRIEYDGVVYSSVQNAYEAASLADKSKRAAIVNMTGREAMIYSANLDKVPGWADARFSVMAELLRQKFSQDSRLAERLLATGTGALQNLVFEEVGAESNTWARINKGKGNVSGLDKLGAALTEIRSELRANNPNPLQDKTVFQYVFESGRGASEIEHILNNLVLEDPWCRMNHQPYEVAAGLYSGPRGQYAVNRHIDDFGHNALLDDLRAVDAKSTMYAETCDTVIRQQVLDAKKILLNNNSGNAQPLKTFFSNLSKRANVRSLVDVDPFFIVDSTVSVLAPTYAVTEKAMSDVANLFLYPAVSYHDNGGMYSHMTVGGDRSLNKMSADDFWESPPTIARLFTDPDFEIMVYDHAGREPERALSMEAIFGHTNPTEAELWAFLEAHPRVAMALRTTTVNNSVDSDGHSSVIATRSLAETIAYINDPKSDAHSVEKRAMRMMMDRPGFLALLSATVNASGQRSYLVRSRMIPNVYKLINFIRTTYKDGVVNREGIEVAIDSLFLDAFGAERIKKIDAALELADEQEAIEESGGVVQEHEDIRPEKNVAIGRMRESMKRYLISYAEMMADPESGIPPLAPGTIRPSALFLVKSESTRAAYFDVEQQATTAKAQQDVELNGKDTAIFSPLIALTYVEPLACDAERPDGISIAEFLVQWKRYIGRRVEVSDGKWVHVSPTNARKIVREAQTAQKMGDGDGLIRVEDPSRCTNPGCPCVRHSTADQSTKNSGFQTPALARLITNVRTMSAEALNLKARKRGVDALDSIKKIGAISAEAHIGGSAQQNNLFDNPLFRDASAGIVKKIQDEYTRIMTETGNREEALASSRKTLAKHMDSVFRSMGYKDEILLDDFANIAHILIRELPADESGIPKVRVLSIGQLNNIVAEAIRIEVGIRGELNAHQLKDAGLRALVNDKLINGTVSIETILAGVKVHRQSRMRSKIANHTEGEFGRNIELIRRIQAELKLKPISQKALDAFEATIMEKHIGVLKYWSGWVGFSDTAKGIDIEHRSSYRLAGFVDEKGEYTLIDSIGPKNAIFIRGLNLQNRTLSREAAESAVTALVDAHKRGLNVIVEGRLPESVTDEASAMVGFNIMDQAMTIPTSKGKARGFLVPMFDIQLNGISGSATSFVSSMNAGVVRKDPNEIGYIAEVVINEYGLGDSDLARTRKTDALRHSRAGYYPIPLRKAFANLISWISDPLEGEKRPKIKQCPPGMSEFEKTRVAVFGPKAFTDYRSFVEVMESTDEYQAGRISEILISDEKGTSVLAKRWAAHHGIPVKKYVPDWTLEPVEIDGKLVTKDHAGIVSTEQMLDRAHVVVNLFSQNDGVETRPEGSLYGEKGSASTAFYKLKDKKISKPWYHYNPDSNRMTFQDESLGIEETGDFEPLADRKVRASSDVVPQILNESDLLRLIEAYKSGKELNWDFGQNAFKAGSADDIRFREAMYRFVSRAEVPGAVSDGYLREVAPGEIAGIIAVRVDNTTWLHPVRPFEIGNDSGAPTSMEIHGLDIDEGTGNVVVAWSHSGDMTGRYTKTLEDINPSSKYMGRPESIPDMELKDGTFLDGLISWATNAGRRLDWRRQQKLISLTFKARTDPYGYNLVVDGGALTNPEDAALRQAIETGNTEIGLWIDRLNTGKPIEFFELTGDEATDAKNRQMNKYCNWMAARLVRYNVDPTIMFASYHMVEHEGQMYPVANEMFFNFQLVIQGELDFMDSYMMLMHRMNPDLCPDGINDTNDQATLFDRNLQVLRPVRGNNGEIEGWERVDIFGGFHFHDEHYYGNSRSGSNGATRAMSAEVTSAFGGKKLEERAIRNTMIWSGRMYEEKQDALPADFRMVLGGDLD